MFVTPFPPLEQAPDEIFEIYSNLSQAFFCFECDMRCESRERLRKHKAHSHYEYMCRICGKCKLLPCDMYTVYLLIGLEGTGLPTWSEVSRLLGDNALHQGRGPICSR